MVKRKLFASVLLCLLFSGVFAAFFGGVNVVEAQDSHIIGSTNISSGGVYQDANGRLVGRVFTMPISAPIYNMSVYFYVDAISSITAKCAVYTNVDKVLVAESEERVIDLSLGSLSSGWYTFDFSSPVELDGDVSYLFACWGSVDVGSDSVFYPKVSGTSGGRILYAAYNGSYPSVLVASAENIVYPLYSVYSDNVHIVSSPEINAAFTLDGSSGYSTPDYLSLDDDNHTFLAVQSKVYGGNAYNFTQWLVNGTLDYFDLELTLNITAPTNITAVYSKYSGLFNFYGPYDELTGELLNENVTVTAHYANGTGIADYSFVLNGTWVYPPDYEVQYFEYLFDDGSIRQYWVDPSEVISSLYVFKGNSSAVQDYVINFLDYTGVLKTYPFVTAKAYINGSLWTVEKRVADEQGSILVNLINGEKYQLTVGNADVNFVYGDLLMTDDVGVQLYLKGVDFPKETLLMYKYVNLYATRDFSTNSILFVYNDTKSLTNSVSLVFTDLAGNVAHEYEVLATNAFQYNWTSAYNWTSYQLVVSIDHEDYGEFDWRQFFPNVNGDSAAMFDFTFLGDWSFDMTYIVPAILLLFAAGCFSALNAEVGAFALSVMAIILTWMGWIPIPAGALVAGFALSILMALVYNKRRSQGL